MARKNCTHILLTFATMFALQGAMEANNNSTTKPSIADYTRPLNFEPNRGQADKQVDFLAHGAGYGLFLLHAEAVIVLQRGSAKADSRLSGTTARLRPVGANASSRPEPLDQQPSKSNYFIGNVPEHWHTGVPNYAKVRYRNVYPGIDMIYHGNQRQLEYDFVVSPGADPARILLNFQGTAKPALDRSGNLVMHTAAGDLHWHKPIAYQEINGNRKLIACGYARRASNLLGFNLATYEHTTPLIIDPVLEYSTYLGGSGSSEFHAGDAGSAITVDRDGNAYATGFTWSPDFPTRNAFQNTLKSGVGNAFVAKFAPNGNLVYSTYLGGSGVPFGGDAGKGIAVDRTGHAYVTGYTYSADFPIKNPFQPQNNSAGMGSNVFVTKFDTDGDSLVYSTYLGGSSAPGDVGLGIAIDFQGNAYVAGETFSPDFPVKNAFQGTSNGGYDAFLAKFDPTGNALVYSTYLGGSGNDVGAGIAIDEAGNVYIAGFTQSPDFPIQNAFQPVNVSCTPICSTAFVAKFNATGTALVYSTYLGGSNYDQATGIAVDAHDNAYVVGLTQSSDFPTKNAFQKELRGYSNAFVTKFDVAGISLTYSTYLGGSGGYPGDAGYGVAVDRQGRAYITGSTTSIDFPTKDAFQSLNGAPNNGNAFVTELDRDGDALVYSSYLGGNGKYLNDSGNGIAVDKNGNAYVTGTTGSTDFPTKDAFQDTFNCATNSCSNAFVTKISDH